MQQAILAQPTQAVVVERLVFHLVLVRVAQAALAS
jgi:hypothetical protein